LIIEKFFGILKDGEWHDLTEISVQIEVQTNKLTELSQFLSKRCIIIYEEEANKIKIKPEWQNLLPDEIEPA
jgi:F0F1-type ATP synthase gamma subunit